MELQTASSSDNKHQWHSETVCLCCSKFKNNFIKSSLGGPVVKAIILLSCFLDPLLRNSNKIPEQKFNYFYEWATRYVHLPLRKKKALPEELVKCTHLEAYQIHRGGQLK